MIMATTDEQWAAVVAFLAATKQRLVVPQVGPPRFERK